MNYSNLFWKHYLLKKCKPELCILKQSYTPFLFNNLLRPSKENIINGTNSAGLQKYIYFFNMFFCTPSKFSFGYNPMLTFLGTKSIVIDSSLKRSDRKKRSPFLRILICFYDFKRSYYYALAFKSNIYIYTRIIK